MYKVNRKRNEPEKIEVRRNFLADEYASTSLGESSGGNWDVAIGHDGKCPVI